MICKICGKPALNPKKYMRIGPWVIPLCDQDHIYLKQFVMRLGADGSKIIVVGNGVDTDKFHRVPGGDARKELGLDPQDQVIISVGGLLLVWSIGWFMYRRKIFLRL